MRVLLIEDDARSAQAVELVLGADGFNVYTTDLGEEGVDLAKLYDYDAVVLDLTLPDISGFDVIRLIRRAKVRTPILVLCPLADLEDKVKALGLGADDYMTTPYAGVELVARLHALVRRACGQVQSIITTGNLTVDLNTRCVAVDGVAVDLTAKEYQMLELLSLRKGMTLTKEAFLSHLYGGMDEPEAKIIDVFICKLRKKLLAHNGHRIETIWGRGYVLRDVAGGVGVSMSSEVSSIADEPPVHVSKMSFAEYDAMKFARSAGRARA